MLTLTLTITLFVTLILTLLNLLTLETLTAPKPKFSLLLQAKPHFVSGNKHDVSNFNDLSDFRRLERR